MHIRDLCFYKTRSTLLWVSLLSEPLIALYAWLPFILRKDVGANALHIALLTMLRPAVSLLSFYWGSYSCKRNDKLIFNIVLPGLLARAPFLLFPFFDAGWFIVLASALYMLFSRAGVPAWMEILKLNLPKKERERLFSWSSAIGYAEGVLIALGLGTLLDAHGDLWKWLFFTSALLGISATLLQKKIPIKSAPYIKNSVPLTLLQPWKETLQLMRTRKDFALFQWGFMAGGIGIMLVIAVLPLFFVDVLHLSHADFAQGRSIWMGLGFILFSPLWAKVLDKQGIFLATSYVCMGFALFPALLLLAHLDVFWFNIAYLIYGIAQGGSHLVWHMSGPIFAKQEESAPFSCVNVIMVGIRGVITPFLGSLLYHYAGAPLVFVLGICFCGYGSLLMRKEKLHYGKSTST